MIPGVTTQMEPHNPNTTLVNCPDRSRRLALTALLLLVPAPSIGAAMAMKIAPGPVGQAVFLVSKIWLLMFPVIWSAVFDPVRPAIPRPTRTGMWAACLSGTAIFLGIAGVYAIAHTWQWFDAAALSATAVEVGLTTPLIYLAGAVYWCTVNSLLEEYVWRWFVFTRWETLLSRTWSVIAAGACFTLHHVIALSAYFNGPVTLLTSLGVFIGGATWSWLYLRYRNIYASWVSHVFADIVIFLIGYQLIFGK